ncbi:hypothetical protein C0989_008676 [Termitomyces sp. Mn162]|nr:hypothetical protein C0989_008676 [Termitomyces sp. Mn162]
MSCKPQEVLNLIGVSAGQGAEDPDVRGDVALEWASSSLEPPPSIMEVFLCNRVEVLIAVLIAWEEELQWVREDQDTAWVEKEALERAWNTSVRVAPE